MGSDLQFAQLRSVRWRINQGILPSSSIYDIRRVTADSRRRYAGLRRRLLVDSPLPMDASNSPILVIDNPLSQNPDSSWGRFFRNAELEKMVDQDLSRLYPEHGNYFQTPGCQGILRRILLVWCLRHPECGYKQGMHELLAPLLYVLHIDVERLSQVRGLYGDHFTDKFDELSFHENDHTYNFDLKKFPNSLEGEIASRDDSKKVNSLDELDPEIRNILLLSDPYGAESELGIVLSEKFMEHDLYCMFDALMIGANGLLPMSDFFSPSPSSSSKTGSPPVIEASSEVYDLLSIVDSSLHSHLVELAIEPQYFALRWLRVLFGREFSLEELLIIWDEVFASNNTKPNERGFILAVAVSMLLHLRSSLLATENAASCLQRLLNFPGNVNLDSLITKAKSLQNLALDNHISDQLTANCGVYEQPSKSVVRARSLTSNATSPKTPLNFVPESYWEEKWRDIHKEGELKHDSLGSCKKGWSHKIRLSLSRTESDPSPSKVKDSVRRRLIVDLSREHGAEEFFEKNGRNEAPNPKDERSVSGNSVSEENLSICSRPTSPDVVDNDNNTAKSSFGSNVTPDENDYEPSIGKIDDDPSIEKHDYEACSDNKDDSALRTRLKERKGGRFQWLWKIVQNNATVDVASEKCVDEAKKSTGGVAVSSTKDCVDQNAMATLRNLGQNMLENIQVIESVLEQERGHMGGHENVTKIDLVGKEQVTAMSALAELRKISNLLSEM